MSDSTTQSSSTPTAADRYTPQSLEPTWMSRWLESGHFAGTVPADQASDPRPSFTIMLPPPNVTGALHMGHALNGSIQDALCRWRRMEGYNVLWQPGIDHAGIATQMVVERTLREEGTTRQELGRQAFTERVWAWKEQYGSTIIEQFKALGVSMDYDRERFTMDDAYHRAVQVAFTRLYDKGYIYRDRYLVNWDAGTMSAISDLEVKQIEVEDEMVEVDYPLEDGSGHLTIATVRPETIVADVAVAVHPSDERYTALIGKNVCVPMTDRVVPIIADDHVDPEFKTGALKITPGHDINDFEIGKRHSLKSLSAIEPDRTMSELAGKWAGMPVDDAKGQMVDEVDRLGLLRSREPYKHMVPHSDRSGVRIEPLISLQWFCDMTELAKPANAAVAQGEVRFHPEGARSIYSSWMDNLRPWCLSRQLWWGHRLPVWYRGDEVHVSADGPVNAEAEGWVQDEDVLDTWFSSGLWDFATLGWPEATPELEYYHPTSVLCTARDIINLWVARMMMLSFEFMGEKPFSDVYIHAIIQAADGRRMSKSLGTGVDPLDLISEFGADATRYGLLTMSSTQDVRFNKGKIQEGRDFANKLWNAVRLLEMFGDPDALAAGSHGFETGTGVDGLDGISPVAVEDRWILARLSHVTSDLTKHLEAYDFAQYAKTLYSFAWSELCDWYLEAVKSRLRDDDHEIQAPATQILAYVVDMTLRLAHPVMPHITEELAHRLWGSDPSRELLVACSWPTVRTEHLDASAEGEFPAVQHAVSTLRSLRVSAGVAPRQALEARLLTDRGIGEALASSRPVIASMANVAFLDDEAQDPASGIRIPLDGGSIVLFGLDQSVLGGRLQDDLQAARGEVKRAEGKLSNARFVDRAPAELVDEERAKIAMYGRRVEDLEAILSQL